MSVPLVLLDKEKATVLTDTLGQNAGEYRNLPKVEVLSYQKCALTGVGSFGLNFEFGRLLGWSGCPDFDALKAIYADKLRRVREDFEDQLTEGKDAIIPQLVGYSHESERMEVVTTRAYRGGEPEVQVLQAPEVLAYPGPEYQKAMQELRRLPQTDAEVQRLYGRLILDAEETVEGGFAGGGFITYTEVSPDSVSTGVTSIHWDELREAGRGPVTD